jgi:hypothetical protein
MIHELCLFPPILCSNKVLATSNGNLNSFEIPIFTFRWTFKSQNFDVVLFHKVGKFYEVKSNNIYT